LNGRGKKEVLEKSDDRPAKTGGGSSRQEGGRESRETSCEHEGSKVSKDEKTVGAKEEQGEQTHRGNIGKEKSRRLTVDKDRQQEGGKNGGSVPVMERKKQ